MLIFVMTQVKLAHVGSGDGDFRPPSSEAVFEEKVHDQKTQGGQEIKEDTQADVHF